ncbi:MAG: cupredoxin domain-containing protein [Bradyrhizobium sp.]|nr:MAG: cupredoxin domain-containing protein [Bradyrhizobium sp.]
MNRNRERTVTHPLPRYAGVLSLALAAALAFGGAASAEDLTTYSLTLKNHRFTPAEIHVPTGKAFLVSVKNLDDTADEFDMHAPAIEKVIAPGGEGTVRIRPLGPGRFPFTGEYHADTAQGVIVSE